MCLGGTVVVRRGIITYIRTFPRKAKAQLDMRKPSNLRLRR
jgi:hypothetical protein